MIGSCAPVGAVRFAERLPAKLRGAVIYAVSAQDHYLRLHTSKGSDLFLMRVSDAIAELDGSEGAQTHRSWWVVREADYPRTVAARLSYRRGHRYGSAGRAFLYDWRSHCDALATRIAAENVTGE